MGNRHEAREKALEYLYQVDVGVETTTRDVEKFLRHFRVEDRLWDYFREVVKGVTEQAGVIDVEIQEVAENWRLSRMSRLDRCILRIATWEALFKVEVPNRVLVDEAIELAKKFGDKNSPSFVNGVLDKIVKRNRKGDSLVQVAV